MLMTLPKSASLRILIFIIRMKQSVRWPRRFTPRHDKLDVRLLLKQNDNFSKSKESL
jgi:hypothetical protein